MAVAAFYTMQQQTSSFIFFFFNDTATTEIYTLSLHDALPIFDLEEIDFVLGKGLEGGEERAGAVGQPHGQRSEEHTSELQSPCNLVCRLLLEKKKYKLIIRDYLPHIHRTTAHSRMESMIRISL